MGDSSIGLGNCPQLEEDVEAAETRSRPIPSTNNHTSEERQIVQTPTYRKSKPSFPSSVAEQLRELEGIEKSLLFRHMRPLFYCMRIFGIYFKHQSNDNGPRALKFLCNNCTPQRLYCLFVNAILIYYFIWSFVAFRVCSPACITCLIL